MESTYKVKAAWIPQDTTLASGDYYSQFCDIEIEFSGVTPVTVPPCADPSFTANGTQQGDPCVCGTTDPITPGFSGVPLTEIRFRNLSSCPDTMVKILPYACSSSFLSSTANNPGVLYANNVATPNSPAWRDGLYSAMGWNNANVNFASGCSGLSVPSNPPTCWSGRTYTGPRRSINLTELTRSGDGTYYSLWTNHFPKAVWYIGLPQYDASTGQYLEVPDVPFYLSTPVDFGQSGDTLQVDGVDYKYQATVGSNSFWVPGAPAPGLGTGSWPIASNAFCTSGTPACSPLPAPVTGVDYQQFEITLDGVAADISDVTYIDFANVPLNLRSFHHNDTVTPLAECGFTFQTTKGTHVDFGDLVDDMKTSFPGNLYWAPPPVDCTSPSGQATQAVGPNKTISPCGNSPYSFQNYPCAISMPNYRDLFTKLAAHQSAGYQFFDGQPVTYACGWIYDWVGEPNSDPARAFEYNFLLQLVIEPVYNPVIPNQEPIGTSYTLLLKGSVNTYFPTSDGTQVPVNPSADLTIQLGTDIYYNGNLYPPVLDLTRAIDMALTPGNLPPTLGSDAPNYRQCTGNPSPGVLTVNLPFATVSLCGQGESTSASNISRVSDNWYNFMNQYFGAQTTEDAWFGPGATQDVTALIGRVMGDAYAGLALGFLASEAANPIIPQLGLAPAPWPKGSSAGPHNYYPYAHATTCQYPLGSNNAYWQTPSGSWWGGNLFKSAPFVTSTNPGTWSTNCTTPGSSDLIFEKHYGSLFQAPPTQNLFSPWGKILYLRTDSTYAIPYEDRLQNYNSGIKAYAVPNPHQTGSFNHVDLLELTFWDGISKTSAPLQGDFDADGDVDGTDLNKILSEWGNCGQRPGGCQSDLNQDGMVDSYDLAVLLANWSAP